jgi:hypothetical protein
LIQTHGESELPASELLNLLQLDAVCQLDGSGVEQLEKLADDSDAEIWDQHGDQLLQTVVEVDGLADRRAAVGQPDLVSLDVAVRTPEDQIGVEDWSEFSLRPELGQYVLPPFVMKTLT